MKTEKKFDAVKMMREIRDELSEKFQNMNYKEQKRFLKENIKSKIRGLQRE